MGVYVNLADRILQYIKQSNYAEAIESVNFSTLFADTARVNVNFTPAAIALIEKSENLDIGAVSNELQWVFSFIEQLRIELNLKYTTNGRLDSYGEIYGVYRYTDESDASYRNRVLFAINGRKLTKWAVIDAIQDYFAQPIFIYENQDAAFYDVSFFEFYGSVPTPGLVMPAFIRDTTSAFYFEIFIPIGAFADSDSEIYGFTDIAFFDNEFLSATGTTGLNWNVIFDLINATKAAGISYTIFIER